MNTLLQRDNTAWKTFFFRCFTVSLICHLLAAWFSVGYQYQDEQSQVFEFAGYKLGLFSQDKLSWEFKDEIRPALQPLAIFAIYRLQALFNAADPFAAAFIARLLAAILGWYSTLIFTREAMYRIQSVYWQKFLAALSALIWFSPFIHAHFSVESLSGSFIFIAVACIMRWQRFGKTPVLLLMAAGASCGVAFILRGQVVFMLAGLGLWCIIFGGFRVKEVILLAFPAAAMLGLGMVIDRWFYGHWVFTSWNYFHVNLVENKVSQFGVSPPWYYLYIYYLNLVAPISVFVMGVMVYAWVRYPKHILTWLCVPFVIGHSLIGHKEVRFFFPMAEAIPVLLVLPFQYLDKETLKSNLFRWPVWILWGADILLLLIFTFKPANNRIGALQYIYRHSPAGVHSYVFIKNQNPYKMSGVDISFYKPREMTVISCDDPAGEMAALTHAGCKQAFMVLDSTSQVAAIEKQHPELKRVYKSLPMTFNYFSINPGTWNQVWYVYEIKK